MTIKELIMLIIWLGLVGLLVLLKTDHTLFTPKLSPKLNSNLNAELQVTDDLEQSTVKPQTTEEIIPPKDTLPDTLKAQVQIPNWLPDDSNITDRNLTANDLLTLAQLAHDNDHDFFPAQQNALYYLLMAKANGTQSPELELLSTTLHAQLYDDAEMAIENYDDETLTALTSRLKSLAPEDPKIQQYTDYLSTLFTLQRLTSEASDHLDENDLYTINHEDAIHKLQQAQALDPNYPAVVGLEFRLLATISKQAIRAAEEGDFEVANAQLRILENLNADHPLTQETSTLIQQQNQERFNYLDQQFYVALKSLHLDRADDLLADLTRLKLSSEQIENYRQQLQKSRNYGPYSVFDVFSDGLDDVLPDDANQNNHEKNQGPDMVVMPLGGFFMGRRDGPRYQKPVHLVEFKQAFAIAQHEITVGQFGQFVNDTGYLTTAERLNSGTIYNPNTGRFKIKRGINWRHDYLGKKADTNLPVIHVSWRDAKAYSQWLSQKTGEPYRLPSESEFEYALKAGSQDLYPWGSSMPQQTIGNLSGGNDRYRGSRVRWREGVENYQDGYWGPAPVGQFPSNLFGLKDLSGNVMEWIADCWHDSYVRAPDDGSAWVNKGCEKRVIRGGHWGSALPEYQSSHRKQAENALTDPRLGFRVAKSLTF